MTIGLVATLTVQAGKGSDFEAAFADLQKIVKVSEPGCLQYDLFKSQKEENLYVVYEQYADDAALKAHAQTDEAKAGMKKMGAFLGGAPTVQVLTKVS